MCIAFVQSFATLVVVRLLLGLFEAGIIPGLLFAFSKHYCRHELVTRVGVMASFASLSGSFGGLLAIGLSKIPPGGMLHSWRWIFLIEGLLTMFLGVVAFFKFPDDPVTDSFFDEREKEVAKFRIFEEVMSERKEKADSRTFRLALVHVSTQLIALGLCCSLLCMNSIGLFMPTLLQSMGFSSVRSQLLTVPPYVFGTIVCIVCAMTSDKLKSRGIILSTMAALIIVGFALLATIPSKAVRYFAIFLSTAGGYTASPILLAWSVDNAAGPEVRAIVAGYGVGMGNAGSIISTWTYLPKDAPRYLRGHYINLGFGVLLFIVATTLTIYLRWENRQRAAGNRDWRLQEAGPEGEQDLGHRHPSFRYTV